MLASPDTGKFWAHVFEINQETRASWLPKSDTAVPLSFVVSGTELSIVGTKDDGKVVLNCALTPKSVFHKRSQKFGQWNDKNGMIYGLGFSSESELIDFMETFRQLVRELNPSPNGPQTAAQPAQVEQNHNSMINQSMEQVSSSEMRRSVDVKREPVAQETIDAHDANNNSNNNGFNNGTRYPRSQSMFGMQQPQKATSSIDSRASPDGETQLKYENEQLKQALEESTKNAGVWQNELINLRTNNAKLTQALQESKAHVEEWEKELLGLRNENKELQNALRDKDDEIDRIKRAMEDRQSNDQSSSGLAIDSYQKQMDTLVTKLATRIDELDIIRSECAQLSKDLNLMSKK